MTQSPVVHKELQTFAMRYQQNDGFWRLIITVVNENDFEVASYDFTSIEEPQIEGKDFT